MFLIPYEVTKCAGKTESHTSHLLLTSVVSAALTIFTPVSEIDVILKTVIGFIKQLTHKLPCPAFDTPCETASQRVSSNFRGHSFEVANTLMATKHRA